MELGSQNHNGDGLLGPNSIIVVYMDPLGTVLLMVMTHYDHSWYKHHHRHCNPPHF